MANTTLRSQLTGAILGKTSAKEIDLIAEDLNFFKKKSTFVDMYRDATKSKRSFLVVNFTNDDSPYMDGNFEPIFIEEK